MISTRRWFMLAAAGLLCVSMGCVSVKAPEKIQVGSSRPEPVDTSRLPDTATHQECRQELYQAYQNIHYLEGENRRLEEKAAKYKRERDECEDRLERYED